MEMEAPSDGLLNLHIYDIHLLNSYKTVVSHLNIGMFKLLKNSAILKLEASFMMSIYTILGKKVFATLE